MNPEGKQTSTAQATENSISYAILDDRDVAVIRVSGKGNFVNSVPLKSFAQRVQSDYESADIIIDLDECETMDSTFMGVLASISMKQIRTGHRKLVLSNTNAQCTRLLKTLGIANLVELHECAKNGADACNHIQEAEERMETAPEEKISHVDQICHTLEAHRTLVKADGENEVRFQSVIHYLERSLEEEQ